MYNTTYAGSLSTNSITIKLNNIEIDPYYCDEINTYSSFYVNTYVLKFDEGDQISISVNISRGNIKWISSRYFIYG